jgi:tRNA(Ile)-lysidine synthase
VAFTPEKLLDRLVMLPPAVTRYLIGFSGGLDSTVLLHALVQLEGSAQGYIEAAHVHHGLQPQANGWADHCRRVCERFAVPFKLIYVDAEAAKGESPEAAARYARYRALQKFLTAGTCLLTAHQQDDQAETLVLQSLRGSGPAGLAAMPEIAAFGGGWHARPLLCFTRAELLDYATIHKLDWVDDSSNCDTAASRNYVRHKVMPTLRGRWPKAAHTLTRVAELQAEASQLLAELAMQDLGAVRGSRPETVSVSGLMRLSPARQRNALRYWLTERGLLVPSRRQLEHVQTDAIGARRDGVPTIKWPGGEVRRYRDNLFAMTPLRRHDSTLILHWDARRALPIAHLGVTLYPSILQEARIASIAGKADITIRFRRGGERCRVKGQRHHRDLKKLLQEAGVPPWERDRIPLIYAGERLLAVVEYWLCD